ncbi:oligopeptide/dipeptide ABC transporter ATP-binding protein [Fuchsiella alkaliacetigena]|uniref:oligopeptide/dipeptide ABC transporter ATP-binding protein n=1 Tax=Fuchsiella alkaliacetigena TaxID=957042 RepID=UPI00200AF7DB|nr:oligopeptide/dipeptide ABC transporter ATP-binding protein [Fuchsiella alkaliacetigena]MCK8825496.1 ATP-binding cassette domain-containing protein [Fuchsiella alkaliacetigena]
MKDYKPLLQVDHLSINYQDEEREIKAIDDISLQLKQGENLGIVGEAGSGKSSLALTLLGLLEQGCYKGEVIYEGNNLLELSNKELEELCWPNLALVHNQDSLKRLLNIGEQIREVLNKYHDFSLAELKEKEMELFELVDLDPKWKNYNFHSLPKRVRKRVLLLKALCSDPEILIIDEIASGLDLISKIEILKLLSKLQQRLDLTMIILSKNIELIKQLTSKVIILYCGQIIEQGSTSKVLTDPHHPYTWGLLNSGPNIFRKRSLWEAKGEVRIGGGCCFAFWCCASKETCTSTRPSLEYINSNHSVACHKKGIKNFLEAVAS